ncbi:MAG: GldM family protein [Bacteroidales bacterium]|jgi:gliding motility-associated protein GldM|nr:GldM family protein [Bacteroidales bacterium]
MAGYKETPRQKMIAMLYLVLTALLALNVSKEILDAFLVVNESMETTKAIVDRKVGNIYQQFAQQDMLNHEKVGEHFEKAKLAREYSADMIKYLENTIFQAVKVSERKDSLTLLDKYYELKSVPDPLEPGKTIQKPILNLKQVPSKDKYDMTTTYFINWGNATKLREKIDEYRTKMEELIPEEYRSRVKIGLRTDEEYSDADGNSQTWEMHNFYHTILAADVTILNKLIAEVQTTEFDVVSELFNEISLTDFKFDAVTAKIIPKTNYIIKGQKYEAEVLVAAYDDKANPDVYIVQGAGEITDANLARAQKWEGEGGIVKLEWNANSEGPQRFAGIIEITNPEGEKERHPFVHEYIVAPPSLTVAAKKMNVFYRAVDNPVSISVPGIAKNKIRPFISAGEIVPDPTEPGDWIVRITEGVGAATVSAQAEYQGQWMDMGSFEFRVKRVPDPVAEIAKMSQGDIDRNELLGAGAIIPVMKDFEFDLNFIVTSFRMGTIINGDWVPKRGSGNRLNDEMQDMIRNSRRGQKFFFENIQAEGPDGSRRTLNTINLTIK